MGGLKLLVSLLWEKGGKRPEVSRQISNVDSKVRKIIRSGDLGKEDYPMGRGKEIAPLHLEEWPIPWPIICNSPLGRFLHERWRRVTNDKFRDTKGWEGRSVE